LPFSFRTTSGEKTIVASCAVLLMRECHRGRRKTLHSTFAFCRVGGAHIHAFFRRLVLAGVEKTSKCP
jgi:hypothetical protein